MAEERRQHQRHKIMADKLVSTGEIQGQKNVKKYGIQFRTPMSKVQLQQFIKELK